MQSRWSARQSRTHGGTGNSPACRAGFVCWSGLTLDLVVPTRRACSFLCWRHPRPRDPLLDRMRRKLLWSQFTDGRRMVSTTAGGLTLCPSLRQHAACGGPNIYIQLAAHDEPMTVKTVTSSSVTRSGSTRSGTSPSPGPAIVSNSLPYLVVEMSPLS